jgi:hypothetical protein
MEVLKVKNWKELIGNRKEWNNLVEKVKSHPVLYCCRRRRRRRSSLTNYSVLEDYLRSLFYKMTEVIQANNKLIQ